MHVSGYYQAADIKRRGNIQTAGRPFVNRVLLLCLVSKVGKDTYNNNSNNNNNRNFAADRQLKLNFHLPKTNKNRKLCVSVRVA
jgi:hypothetical protein